MTTLEMLNEAQRTNRTYVSSMMKYSIQKGFHFDGGKKWPAKAFEYVNDIFELSNWHILQPKKMTFNEIERELGYSIELVSGE